MPISLRPRTNRKNYAEMLNLGSDDEETEAKDQDQDVNLGNSASDFSESAALESALTDLDDNNEDMDMDVDVNELEDGEEGISDVEDSPNGRATITTSRSLAKRQGRTSGRTVKLTPSLSRTAYRQQYALPTPSADHRFRAEPLYSPSVQVERLEERPMPFAPCAVKMTNCYTQSKTVFDRINRAWNHNVGPGPLWELIEDRLWWKEGAFGNDEARESSRRPLVYTNAKVAPNWSIMASQAASSYLPKGAPNVEDGLERLNPPILTCFFGPHENQMRKQLQIFDSFSLSEHLPESSSHVFNAGGPVWALDWCPLHVDGATRDRKQYLAVAPFPNMSYSPGVNRRKPRPNPACIQIWVLSSFASSSHADAGDKGNMACELVLCIDSGPALDLKWCPLPSHDALKARRSVVKPRKLGLLGGVFEDGSVSIYVVPYPEDLGAPSQPTTAPTFVRMPEPLIRIEMEHTSCLSFDWANSEVIAVGCTNGAIAVYNVAGAIHSQIETADLPTHYLTVHQSAIRGLTWIRTPPYSADGDVQVDQNPTAIVSGGFDGTVCFSDIRQGRGNVLSRTRDVIQCMGYSPYVGGPLAIDNDSVVKVFSASPSMLGRGHMLLEPGGPVWSISGSDYHAQIAVGAADGSCVTTNALRSTRRGKVPVFQHKIFQMDYSRKSGEYRMLERFLPDEVQDSKQRADNPVGSAAWTPGVSVTQVRWNNGSGPGKSPWLVSATACGLCRVDWLMGRWMQDKVPYNGVEFIRDEVGGLERDESGEDET